MLFISGAHGRAVARSLLVILVVALALVGCTAPPSAPPANGTGALPSGDAPSPTAPGGPEEASRVLVVGVHAEVFNATEAERVAAQDGPAVTCDRLVPVSANLTAQRLAYASTFGLGRPDAASQWIELTKTAGPQPHVFSRCPPNSYGVSFAPWGERPREFVFGEYRDRIPFAARSTGVVEVNGTRLLAGEHWTSYVDATIDGTRYEGFITIVNLGLWPLANVTEYACTESDCTPPFHEEPDFPSYAADPAEGRRP